MGKKPNHPDQSVNPITLKGLAAYLKLDPATISVVLNDVPGRSIPEATRERIRTAARKFNYQPSFVARSLRNRRTMTIGILVPVLDGYHAEVMNGIGDYLVEQSYFYFIAHHRHRPDLVDKHVRMLTSRGTEGIITVDTHLEHKLAVPVVAVAGHKKISGVTNVILDQNAAALMTLGKLYELGHREIAFMRGQSYSSDADTRWESVVNAARGLGLSIRPELTIHLTRDLTSPELGYPVVQQLLAHHRRFTAIVCFNDITAIGAIRALHDAQLRVPQDISVVGFDDVPLAAFYMPSLTTVRQPLHAMGSLAAQLLLDGIRTQRAMPPEVAVKPELIIRESTGPSRRRRGKPRSAQTSGEPLVLEP
jgi:DNA-binding LacI/PurR family transcriptional regulator